MMNPASNTPAEIKVLTQIETLLQEYFNATDLDEYADLLEDAIEMLRDKLDDIEEEIAEREEEDEDE